MFVVSYNVLEENKQILQKVRSVSEFEEEISTITGQLQIRINNIVDGFIDDEIPYDGEFLITWFKLFNNAVICLKTGSFIAIKLPVLNRIWFEIERKNDNILISKARVEEENSINNFLEKAPRNKKDIFWFQVIKKEEFFSGIIKSTKEFIKEIGKLNKLLLQTNELKELIDIVERAEQE